MHFTKTIHVSYFMMVQECQERLWMYMHLRIILQNSSGSELNDARGHRRWHKYNAPYTSFTFIMIATKAVAKPIFNVTILPKIN